MRIIKHWRKLLASFAVAIAVSGLGSLGMQQLRPGHIIEWTKWTNMGDYSPTLTIHPSIEARLLAATSGALSLVGLHSLDAANAEMYWREAIYSTDTSGHGHPFTLSMHQQFNCHFYMASKNLFQDTWNLDLKRLAEPMPMQVIHLCNNPSLKDGKTGFGW